MTTSTASARQPARPGAKRTVYGSPLWFFALEIALGLVAAVVGLTQPVSPAIGAPFSSLPGSVASLVGILYWTALALVGSSMVVKVRNGAIYGPFLAFIVATAVVGGPPAVVVVSIVGTLEIREFRELRPLQIVTNRVDPLVGAVVGAFVVGWIVDALGRDALAMAALVMLLVTAVATVACLVPSVALVYTGLALRARRPIRQVAREQLGTIILFALVTAAAAWVMVEMYLLVAWWSPVVVLGPVMASWLVLDRDRSRWQADHDPLTQLANRAAFDRGLAVAERRARRSGRSSLVLVIDLDGFKAINDRYGHAAGDEVLQAVARRLEGTCRRGDVVARLGGDEFAVLVPDIGDAKDAERAATRFAVAVAAPVSVGSIEIRVGLSVGVAILSPEMPDAARAMRVADQSLYVVKRQRSRPSDAPRDGGWRNPERGS